MITAFQHVGMGVHDAGKTYKFYKDILGFKVKLNDHTSYMKEMEPIVGALVEMRAIMAMNVMGGGVIELIEHTSTKPMEPERPTRWGDLGYFELGIKARNLDKLFLNLKSRGIDFLTPVRTHEQSNGQLIKYAYLQDPDGLLIQLVEEEKEGKPRAGGVRHVTLGVKDLEAARRFYGEVLGFTDVEDEFRGRLPEIDAVTGGVEMEMVMLKRPGVSASPLPLLESGRIKLIHTIDYEGAPIFSGRRWGDIGMMEFAMDVTDLEKTVEECIAKGAEPYHPPTRVDMGTGSVGNFAYIKDPEGNTVEFVETVSVFWLSPQLVKRALTPVLKAGEKLGIL
jgi:catechol 2,3-dioxygenase-like lactoylglutathione lyase family enzyme